MGNDTSLPNTKSTDLSKQTENDTNVQEEPVLDSIVDVTMSPLTCSDTTSKDVESKTMELLNDIQDEHKYLVIAYIRQNAFNAYKIFIPQYIINFCIVYLFARYEKFDINKNYDNVDIIKNNMIIKYKHDNKDWNNVYGKAVISMNTGIHEWIFKMTKYLSTPPWLLIGIVPSHVIDNYDAEECKKYDHDQQSNRGSENYHWIINEYFNGHAYHVGNGYFYRSYKRQARNGVHHFNYYGGLRDGFGEMNEDGYMIKMIFDTNKRTLKYELNGMKANGEEYGMENISDGRYKMASSSRAECIIQLVSYRKYASL